MALGWRFVAKLGQRKIPCGQALFIWWTLWASIKLKSRSKWNHVCMTNNSASIKMYILAQNVVRNQNYQIVINTYSNMAYKAQERRFWEKYHRKTGLWAYIMPWGYIVLKRLSSNVFFLVLNWEAPGKEKNGFCAQVTKKCYSPFKSVFM